MTRVKSNVRAVKRATKAAIKRGLTDVGMVWHGDAVRLTPVDTGLLRASLAWAVGTRQHDGRAVGSGGEVATSNYRVTAPEGSVRLGTNVEYAPIVHEDVSGRIPRAGGAGGPKFIESPLRERQDAYTRLLAKALREGVR